MTIDKFVQRYPEFDWLSDAETTDADVELKEAVNARSVIWQDGVWEDGHFWTGIWNDGIFRGGKFVAAYTPEDGPGIWNGGRFEGGILSIGSHTEWYGGEFISGEVKVTKSYFYDNEVLGKGEYRFDKDTITMILKNIVGEDDHFRYTIEEWERILKTDSFSPELIEMGKKFAEPDSKVRKDVESHDYNPTKTVYTDSGRSTYRRSKKWESEEQMIEKGKELIREKHEHIKDFRERFFRRVESRK